MPADHLKVAREPLTARDSVELILALNAVLRAMYPEEGANHFRLDEAEVQEGRGVFVVARIDGHPVGCGALRKINPEEAEVKRMYVRPEVRGQGVAQAILRFLEQEARNLGVTRLVLETGTRQTDAIRLYERSGFEPIENFGEYIGCPLSLCFARKLTID